MPSRFSDRPLRGCSGRSSFTITKLIAGSREIRPVPSRRGNGFIPGEGCGFVLLKRLAASPFGVVLQGIRENAGRMRLIGNPVLPQLTAAYAVASGVAGLAGALFTQANAFVGVGVLAIDTSVDVLVMLVLGGVGGLHGALVGTPLYMLLKHFTQQWNPFY